MLLWATALLLCWPQIEEHMRDHAMDEHESLKLFTSDLQGMKLEDEGYEDKMHQLMEVGTGQGDTCVVNGSPLEQSAA
jgi:hypothetical protein